MQATYLSHDHSPTPTIHFNFPTKSQRYTDGYQTKPMYPLTLTTTITVQQSFLFSSSFSIIMIHTWFISQTFPQFSNKMGSFPVKTDICLLPSYEENNLNFFICKSSLECCLMSKVITSNTKLNFAHSYFQDRCPFILQNF